MAVLRIAMAPKVKNHQWFTSSFPLSVALSASRQLQAIRFNPFSVFPHKLGLLNPIWEYFNPENPTVRTSGFYQLAGRIWHGRRKWANKNGRMSFYFFFLDSQWAQVKCLSLVGQFGHKVQETPADVFSFFFFVFGFFPLQKLQKHFHCTLHEILSTKLNQDKARMSLP